VKVLVTGGAGYIGSHTAKALAEAGDEPVVIDDLRTGHRENVRWGAFVEGTIADRELVRRVIRDERVRAVVHFAASAYVGESMTSPRDYYENNAVGSLALLDPMLAEGVDRIVFSSSCATYGTPDRIPIREDDPQRPVNPYGETKLATERALHWYGRAYGTRWFALRYFNAAGADPGGELGEDHDPETHLIPLAIRAALGSAPALQVYGTDYPTSDGTAIRDYIHVADLATAHVAALRKLDGEGAGRGLNLGTGAGHSVREVIAAVERIGGRPVPVLMGPRRDGDPPALVADASAAEASLGWRPSHSSLDEIVETAVRWHERRHDRRSASEPSGRFSRVGSAAAGIA
jgi:UDP-arabinose 4-epimerase